MESSPGTSAAQLSNSEISRYSRQMILPELGMHGQLLLKNSSVLIVGLGGLGCPAAMYLAAAGVGTLCLLDYDIVETSNLHRQVIHSERTVGVSKAESARQFIQGLNPDVTLRTFHEAITSQNAMRIVPEFSLVLDCTDNVATRYLLNDACILAGKPLVSGSALRFEGQLTTYNYEGGPCYRCLFPVPPPPEFVTNCSEGGVLGVIPGIIGSLQALEAIKILAKIGPSYIGKMLIFDGTGGKQFTEVKVRGRQQNCAICCSPEKRRIQKLLDDYPTLCGSSYDDKEKGILLLNEDERISPAEFKHVLASSTGASPPVLIDVREAHELEICALPNTGINVPYSKMGSDLSRLRYYLEQQCSASPGSVIPIYVVCRRGNDSQRAVRLMKSKYSELPVSIRDLIGGLHGWAREVDPAFPVY